MAAPWQVLSTPGGGTDSCPSYQPDDTTSLEEEQDTAVYPEGNHLQMFKAPITSTAEGTNKPQAYQQRTQHPISIGMSGSKEEENSCFIFPMGA